MAAFVKLLFPLLLCSAPAAVAQEQRYAITSAEGLSIADGFPDFIPGAERGTFTGDLEGIRKRRLLRVLVTHSRTDFFLDEGQILGVQAELTYELLKYLNKGIRRESDKLFVQFIPVEFHQLLPALIKGQGDVAAAFLTITPRRDQLVDFITTQKMIVDEVLIANKNAPPITSLVQLSDNHLYILKDSSYSEHLEDLNRHLQIVDEKPVRITESDERLLTEDILELINSGAIDYTICDDYKANLWQKVLPNLVVVDDVKIAKGKSAGWAIRKNSPQLKQALDEFNNKVKKGTLLGNILINKYFGNTKWIANPLEEAERDKLQQLIGLFEKYGGMYGFDPLALAAQAYQESKLNNNAKSHRGAVGIMQMLPTTAKDPNVAIDHVELLENNIHAGAKYLGFLRQRYFSSEDIEPWDQRLFTWAAYNAGPANIIRIRNAASKNGLDANVWFGNVEVMAARMISREPVRYVANVHKYYTVYRLVEERSIQRQHALESQLDKL
jgi:membrane-bound lytic murein transglycosylase MltF